MSYMSYFRGGFTFVELVVVMAVIVALLALGLPVLMSVQKKADTNATKNVIKSVSAAMAVYHTKSWPWEQNFPSPEKKTRYSNIWDLNHRDDNDVKQPDIAPYNSSVLRFYSIDGYTPGSRVEHDPKYREILLENKLPLKVSIPIKAKWDNGTAFTDQPNSTHDGNFPPGVLASGYCGFLKMAAVDIPAKFINKRGNVIDAWGNPLRIQYQAKTFGGESFGIWSAGCDLNDDTLMDGEDSDRAVEYDEGADDLRSWQ